MAEEYPLERYWPCTLTEKQKWEDEEVFVECYHIGHFELRFNGFVITKSTHFDKPILARSHVMVPRLYKNILRLLNAKVSYLQQCARLLSLALSQGSMEAKQNIILARDSVLRLLSLTTSVRVEFFEDIFRMFYDTAESSDRRLSPNRAFPDTYKCRVVDVWAFCEFKVGYHDPGHVKKALPYHDWRAIEPDLRQSDWDNYWLGWQPTSVEPPPYWGPPPSSEAVLQANSWEIPPQPTRESCPPTLSMKKTVEYILSLKVKVIDPDAGSENIPDRISRQQVVPKENHRESSVLTLEDHPQKSHSQDDRFDSNKPAPDELFITGHEGTQFPKGTPRVHWEAHGVSTFTPWIGYKGKSKHGKKDFNAVQELSGKANALSIRQDPPLVTAIYAPGTDGRSQTEIEFISEIDNALANGRLVLVKGWMPAGLREFTMESMAMAGFEADEDVVVQDAKVRLKDPVEPFTTLKMREVIERADLPQYCLNLLDRPAPRGEMPYWLPIMDEMTAWTISRRVTIDRPHPLPLTIRIPAGKSTERSVQKQYKLGTESIGPRVQLTDQMDAGRWVLVTHGGFMTYQHHDAEGFCTYMAMTCGAKIWAILDPDSIRRVNRREELWKVMDEILESDNQKRVAGTLLIQPGDILIQPPAIFHSVYTPTKSISFGGHFLTYNTLHLSEAIRSYDYSSLERRMMATNNAHECVPRLISRMLLALPILCRNNDRRFFERPILALIRMVHSFSNEAKVRLSLRLGDVEWETDSEFIEAEKVAENVREGLGLSWDDVTQKLEEIGDGWKSPGKKIYLSFLN